MCGIVGTVRFQGGRADRNILQRAVDGLQNRGPDSTGVWQDDLAGMAHRRLAIIDLSPNAHQPMLSADGRYTIVFNGEIYNFRELRTVLTDGQAWKSQSDTEVILRAFQRWGTDCVQHLRGMFAFAIWDKQEKILFAARDRLGVKPFYFHMRKGVFHFASRPRPIFTMDSSLSRELDHQAIRFHLEAGYIPAPWSIYQNIRKLPPGHYLLFSEQGMTIRRYWNFHTIAHEPAWDFRGEDDLLDELDQILTRSVQSRLVSDVPVGIFLSGGIDSSLVAAITCKMSSQKVKTFTIGFQEKNCDESIYAEAIARYLGSDHHSERLNSDNLLGLLPTFFNDFDEPFFDSSAFPTMALSRLARRHVTVSLSGEGGDELFGGYHYYRWAQIFDRIFKAPQSMRLLAAHVFANIPGHRTKLLGGALREADPIAAFAFTRSINKDFGAVLTANSVGSTIGLYDLLKQIDKEFPENLTLCSRGMRYDLSYTLPDEYLQKVDLASMAFSLEAREPFLDQDLVEWAMKLPLRWKIRGSTSKYLLRKLSYRYIPKNLLDRPKQGFIVPIDRWLRGPLTNWARQLCEETALYRDLPLDKQKVCALLELHLSGKRNVHPYLWSILMLLEFKARDGAQCSGGQI